MYYVFMLSWQIAVFASYCLGLPRHSFLVSPRHIFICRFDGISSAPAEGDVRIRQYHCSQPSHMKPHVCQKPYVSKKQWAEFGNLIQPIKAKKREVLRLVSSSEKTRFSGSRHRFFSLRRKSASFADLEKSCEFVFHNFSFFICWAIRHPSFQADGGWLFSVIIA